MDEFVIFVLIGAVILVALSTLWYLTQTIRTIWAYNSFLAILAIFFSPIVHIVFYFIPKNGFDESEARLFRKYFLSIGALLLLGIIAGVVIPATSSHKSHVSDSSGSLNAEEMESSASKGDALAQFNIGREYYLGEDRPQDYAKAAEWSEKSANQGYAGAEILLGMMYDEGQGVHQDYAKAAELYQMAANQGEAFAQVLLAEKYYKGKGVIQDYSKTAELYQMAANQGDSHAQLRLGVMYYQGEGVIQNNAQAFNWYEKSANQDNVDAQYMLGIMYSNGQGVSQDYTESKKWFGKACDNGEQAGCDMYNKLSR